MHKVLSLDLTVCEGVTWRYTSFFKNAICLTVFANICHIVFGNMCTTLAKELPGSGHNVFCLVSVDGRPLVCEREISLLLYLFLGERDKFKRRERKVSYFHSAVKYVRDLLSLTMCFYRPEQL